MAALNDAGAGYLVVGAHALAVHGHARASKDLDEWMRATRENAKKVYRALAWFGVHLQELTVDDLATAGTVRVDVLTSIDGVEFDEAWPERVGSTYDVSR